MSSHEENRERLMYYFVSGKKLSLAFVARFPVDGRYDHMFAERFDVYSEEDNNSSVNDKVFGLFKERWERQMTHNSYTMFDIRTQDNHLVAVTKILPYKMHGADLFGAEVNAEFMGAENTNKKILIVTIYSVDVSELEFVPRPFHRLYFLKTILEISLDMVILNMQSAIYSEAIEEVCADKARLFKVDECTEPFEVNCECDKIHLHDYGNVEIAKKTTSTGVEIRRWLVSLSDLCLAIHRNTVYAIDILALIVHRLTRNSFSNLNNEHIRIIYDIIDGRYRYTSKSYRHSEFKLTSLSNEIYNFNTANPIVFEKFFVTVYVSDNRLIELGERTTEQSEATDGYESDGVTLNSRLFISESELWKKAVILPLPVKEAYKILSSKTKLNTTKGRILAFSLELNRSFCNDIIDNSLLLVYICLDVVKSTECPLWTVKKKKITLKLTNDRNSVKVVLRENDCWNPLLLKKDLFRERTLNITGQVGLFKFKRFK